MGRHNFFQGRRKFSKGHCGPNSATDFFHFDINQHQGTKFQPNISSSSGENGDFNSFAIFSNGGHLKISTTLNFTILKPWSLVMLHMKFKIHGYSGLRE